MMVPFRLASGTVITFRLAAFSSRLYSPRKMALAVLVGPCLSLATIGSAPSHNKCHNLYEAMPGMSTRKKPLYAVVTGDVVGSSRLTTRQRRRLLAALQSGRGKLKKYFGDDLVGDVELFRGDSWQFVLSRPAPSARAALFYRASLRAEMALRSVDSRVAIGVGGISLLPKATIAAGDGEAFGLSGEALDSMPRTTRMRFRGPAVGEDLSASIDVSLQLIDALASRWTARQALAVSGALLGWTQERIARAWFREKVTQQAVAQHLGRAGWSAIQAALLRTESLLA